MENIDFAEIRKLHYLLTKAGIPHTFAPIWDGKQIRVYADSKLTYELDDAVIHSGSHGVGVGLLETYHLNECVGWETAEEVFKGWKKMYEEAIMEDD